jgi:O-antigen/teichoic acid export membrane protein
MSGVRAAVAVGAMCLAAPVLVPLLYGKSFAGSVPGVLALGPGMLALGTTRPLGAHLLRLGRPVTLSALTIAAVVVNVLLCVLFVPRWGVVGCAVAASCGYVVLAAAQATWFVRATGTPAYRLIAGREELARITVLLARRRRTRA